MPVALSRRSSSGQDTLHTCKETAVRIRPRRSIVRSLRVEPVDARVVAPMMIERHYLGCMPMAPLACFGVYLGTQLVGGVVFTTGARHSHKSVAGAGRGDVATLARLYLDGEIPKNAESRVLGVVARLLRRQRRVRVLLSYADPVAGHTGTVYRAAGWTYLGRTEPGRYLDFGDGALRHPRSVSSHYGTNSPKRLRLLGHKVATVTIEGKHRFALPLDPSWTWRIATKDAA
jgi:hypothetical protein